jgi:hypothetical protein
MNNEMGMFILQGGLGIIMLFFGIILNGLRTGIDRVNVDLKGLNDAVLGKYMTREDSESKWASHRSETQSVWETHRAETQSKWDAQRTLDHEIRQLITTAMIDAAKASGKPYNYNGEQVKQP